MSNSEFVYLNADPDADDWPKASFDFPDVEPEMWPGLLGIRTPEQARDFISENKNKIGWRNTPPHYKLIMEMLAKGQEVSKHLPGKHNQADHGLWSAGEAIDQGPELGAWLKPTRTKTSAREKLQRKTVEGRAVKNTNKLTAAAKKNLKTVGKRMTLGEAMRERQIVFKEYNSMRKATKNDLRKWCSDTRHGRPTAAQRPKRKMELLQRFGDGHTAGCIYCGVRLDMKTIQIEKLDPVMGYAEPLNTAPACTGCNKIMSDKDPKLKFGATKGITRSFTPKPTKAQCARLRRGS